MMLTYWRLTVQPVFRRREYCVLNTMLLPLVPVATMVPLTRTCFAAVFWLKTCPAPVRLSVPPAATVQLPLVLMAPVPLVLPMVPPLLMVTVPVNVGAVAPSATVALVLTMVAPVTVMLPPKVTMAAAVGLMVRAGSAWSDVMLMSPPGVSTMAAVPAHPPGPPKPKIGRASFRERE